jgi:hypothetical protein
MEIQPEIINYVGDFIDKYRMNENLRFVFTLGKYSEPFGFEPHLFHEFIYTKIKILLESCPSWENINAYNYNSDSVSFSFSFPINKEIDKIIILCKNGSYDIKISVYENFDINSEYVISFKKKNHIFNLGKIKTDINEIYYTFEIISLIPKNYSSIYIGHSSLLKICDILSNLDNTKNFEFDKII